MEMWRRFEEVGRVGMGWGVDGAVRLGGRVSSVV